MSGTVIEELEQLQAEALASVDQARSADELERVRIKFAGRKSRLTEILKSLGRLPSEERTAVGKQANQLKTSLETQLSVRRQALKTPAAQVLDATLPGNVLPQGRLHPITRTMSEILSIFTPMGFEIAEGPEAEFEYYNFDGLNIPTDHPSREAFDTFFIDLPSPEPKKGRLLLRSHTSPVQVRIMERRQPPLRIIVPGTVFRRDAVDASHSFMFHQVEGLMVDDHTNFADLKGTLERFLGQYFGPDTRTRFRPHYFPFTEPSAEVDIAWSGKTGRKQWMEILGCGMVHPNVLRQVGYDPAKVQGFAFGLGVERMAMLKYGITDIRMLFENDLRFLEQF